MCLEAAEATFLCSFSCVSVRPACCQRMQQHNESAGFPRAGRGASAPCLQEHHKHAISKDTWAQLLDFMQVRSGWLAGGLAGRVGLVRMLRLVRGREDGTRGRVELVQGLRPA